jgi:hypothetical protein
MKKNIMNVMLGLMLSTSLLVNQGCVALVVGAAVGAGGFAFIKGNLEQNMDAEVKDVYEASLRALDKLKIDVYSKKLEAHMGVIYAYTQGSDRKRVKIMVQALTEKASNIKVRVGIVGDESRSVQILETIKKEL